MYFVQHYKYVHGGIPPGFEDKEKFMCDQCPSVFFNNLSLKLHYKTKHSDIIKDPAKVGRRNCPHCEKTFATYLSYKEHIKVRIMSFRQGLMKLVLNIERFLLLIFFNIVVKCILG